MFAKQNAQSSNPKVRMLAAEKRFTAAEVSVQRAERDLERAVENAKRVKLEPSARVCAPTRPSPPFHDGAPCDGSTWHSCHYVYRVSSITL